MAVTGPPNYGAPARGCECGALLVLAANNSARATRDLIWLHFGGGARAPGGARNALAKVSSTSNRPGAHGNEKKNAFPAKSAVV
jgi:hypothetical protein